MEEATSQQEKDVSASSTENAQSIMFPNNDIVLPESTDLDWAQINFAIDYNRLMFINNYKTWLSFYIENGREYIDYTPEELTRRFLKRVLPNIYEYELTEDELHLLNLLDLHPHFVRTDSGFNIIDESGKIDFPMNEAAIERFMAQGDNLNEINLVYEAVESNHQIITGPEQDSLCRKFIMNTENAALLSAVLCFDEDLPNCELLPIDELHKRLKAEKTRFENNGGQLEKLSMDALIKKLATISKLKHAVIQLVYENFHTRNDN